MIKINDVIAFYCNSVGEKYNVIFGNTVTLESGIDVGEGISARWGWG